ncbi:unnamed protein product [Rotaria magnacalcarata]|uniref:Uncharacterized protein n=2 Tax=Rotaria magnacalcarata TaxID=392030 RepID=A0A820CM86_9BILA|nr:unnamed protein product [Rotaria magnacalcarata]
MATGDTRKIFSKVAIGPKTLDVVVHEDFQCIVHINRSEMNEVPAPFLSRFQKYSLSIQDFYQIQFRQLSMDDQTSLKNVEEKLKSFIEHFSSKNFCGLNKNTLYSCLLSMIENDEHGHSEISNIHNQYTQLTIKTKSFIEENPFKIQQCLLRSVLSKLMQLVSPESVIFKLPTFEDRIAQLLCNNYFRQQEHFSLENFIRQLVTKPLNETQTDDGETMNRTTDESPIDTNVLITTKVMIYTRTSSYVMSLNKLSKYRLLSNDNNADYETISGVTDILSLAAIENAAELEEKLHAYEQDRDKYVLIIVVNARLTQQRLNIPFVRQLVDRTENACNRNNDIKQRKHFIILIHAAFDSSTNKSYFPSIFLHGWDFYFFDTCTPGSAFHLQKMLQIISSSDNEQEEQVNDILCDLDILFGDCLWDFCSRIQIFSHELPPEMFTDKNVHEFYQRNTTLVRRVQCLKQILQKSSQSQERIINMYHEYISTRKSSLNKTYKAIYDVSKGILSGTYSSGLVDSIHYQIRISFTKFISYILEFIVNDYGLETLSRSATTKNRFESMLNLINLSALVLDDDSNKNSPSPNQGSFQIATQCSCIPQTPLYQLFHQRIKSFADEVKQIFMETKIASTGSKIHVHRVL